MTDQYFWADEVKDKNIDPDSNPAEYFATMKYPEDQWSRITSSKGLGEIADASGYDEGFGYNTGQVTDTSNISGTFCNRNSATSI